MAILLIIFTEIAGWSSQKQTDCQYLDETTQASLYSYRRRRVSYQICSYGSLLDFYGLLILYLSIPRKNKSYCIEFHFKFWYFYEFNGFWRLKKVKWSVNNFFLKKRRLWPIPCMQIFIKKKLKAGMFYIWSIYYFTIINLLH